MRAMFKTVFFAFKRSKILLCTIELTIPFETADCLITIDLSHADNMKKGEQLMQSCVPSN